MSARRKLNSAYTGGSILLAGAFGVMSESWWIFGIALVVLVAMGLYDGDIRPKPGHHPKGKP